MTPSTDLEEVGDYTPEVAALLAQQEEDLGDVQFQTPILKVTQGTTREVKAGDVEAGEFYNTLTSESYGTKVDFVVSYFQKGRAASHKDGRYFVAIGQDIIPDSWADVVGEAFVGTPFSEYPDAEEQYKKRVNSGEIDWGKGPQVSTTYNYTGLVFPPVEDGSEEESEPMPVRISFLRSTKGAHDKLMTLKKALLRNKPFWDIAFELSTQEKEFGRNTSYIIGVKKGRDTTSDEKTLAVELATAVVAGRTAGNDEAASDGPAAPVATPEGALAV